MSKTYSCKRCGTPLEYGGRGRPPVACKPSCDPSSALIETPEPEPEIEVQSVQEPGGPTRLSTFIVTFTGKVEGRNFQSARKRADDLKTRLEKAGMVVNEARLSGEKKGK